MIGKVRAALYKAWTPLWTAIRKTLAKFWRSIFTLCLIAYGFVWWTWGIGGLELLEGRGATIPILALFIVASFIVMLVGLAGFWRDLGAFLRWQPRED